MSEEPRTPEPEAPDWDELNKQEDKRRKATYEQTLEELDQTLSNADGLKRLLEITDEEWQAAEDQDEPEDL